MRASLSELHKIKRLKLSKNLSEDEEDEYFIEKYSGVRTTRKQVAENKELLGFRSQITELNQKFKSFEEATNDLKESIERQNNQVKELLSEMIQIRVEGEKKFQALFKQVFNKQPGTARDLGQTFMSEDKMKVEINKTGPIQSLSDNERYRSGRQTMNTNFPKTMKANENIGWNTSDFADNVIQNKDLNSSSGIILVSP